MRRIICSLCDGTGLLRSNTSTPDGGYMFRKITCHQCKGIGYVGSKPAPEGGE